MYSCPLINYSIFGTKLLNLQNVLAKASFIVEQHFRVEALEILQDKTILAYRFVKAKAEIELLEHGKGLLLEGLLVVLILYLDENQWLEEVYHRPEMLQVI